MKVEKKKSRLEKNQLSEVHLRIAPVSGMLSMTAAIRLTSGITNQTLIDVLIKHMTFIRG